MFFTPYIIFINKCLHEWLYLIVPAARSFFTVTAVFAVKLALLRLPSTAHPAVTNKVLQSDDSRVDVEWWIAFHVLNVSVHCRGINVLSRSLL